MNLLERWNAFMGPKDERLEAESNRYMRIGYIILLAGVCLATYYAIMVNQVADTTDTPIYTAAGQNIIPVSYMLLATVLASGFVTLVLQMKAGIVDEHVRIATVDHIPWDFCAIIGLITGAILGILTTGMRIVAEVQIVGIEHVTWAGDLAMGVVFFGMAFALGTFCTAAYMKSAIERRIEQEKLLDD